MVQAASALAYRLRAARHATGRSITYTAVAADIDPSTLSHVERGVVRPQLDVLYRLACVLQLADLADALRPHVGELEP